MTKNIFRSKYVGPQGRHLSCLTQTSLTGTYEEAKQRSIHPRVWLHGSKKNTSALPGTAALSKAMKD